MEETSQTPPASAGGEAETLVAAKEEDAAAAKEKEKDKAKRARKRSRYLSPPYTDSDAGADISPRREEQDERGDEEASLLLQLQEAKLAAADMLSALHGAALFDASPNRAHANVVDVDVLLRFFTLYRSKVLLLLDDHRSSDANAAGLGINNKKKTPSSSTASTININKDDDAASLSSSLVGLKLLNAVRAMADADGSACKYVRAIKKEDDAMENAHHIGAVNAALKDEAGHKRKKMASASASDGLQASNGVADSAPNKKKKTRKRKAGLGQHFGNPAALVLDFTRGTALPSKEELLSSFRRFGFLIESETDIAKDTRRARVVFGTSAEAEAAYSCAETLGAFGPPFAAPRLQYLSPIKLNAPQPPPSPSPSPSHAPKLPLTDIRKNLEKMISSLTRPSPFRKDDGAKPAVHNLVGEMQGLLAKVDKMLSAGPSSSTTALHRH